MKNFTVLLTSVMFMLTTRWHVAALNQGEQIGAGLIPSPGISRAVYDDLVRYTKYSAAAYASVCSRPMGNTLVQRVEDLKSGTDGMVVRDDRRQEIVVVFRGTSEFEDVLTDIQFRLVPLQSPGIRDVGDAQVHIGFMEAYNTVALNVLHIVKSQLRRNPSYTIVVAGHSLGGAIASFAAISLRAAFAHTPLRLYTFGQPRVGNAAFAAYVENSIGISNIFRAVHTVDGVPALPPSVLGYQHFATEYWNFIDPPSHYTTRQCSGGEDLLCLTTIPSTGTNLPHAIYFGQVMLDTRFVCS